MERRRWRRSRRAWRAICAQLDTADRQEPSEAILRRTARLKEKIDELKRRCSGWQALETHDARASPDQQISLTDPDARSMATSGRGSGVVGYNVQVAVDTEHHLIVTHEVAKLNATIGWRSSGALAM